MSAPRLAIVTRFHDTHNSQPLDLTGLQGWCRTMTPLSEAVIVATDSSSHARVSEGMGEFSEQVEILHVSPWEGYVLPLNSLVRRGTVIGTSHLLVSSVEVRLTAADLDLLLEHSRPGTLVVGAKLNQLHGGDPGEKPLRSEVCPSNPIALWNLDILKLTGFPAISDVPSPDTVVPFFSFLEPISVMLY